MARCESLDIMRKKILENKIIKREPSSDSDSESDITYMLDLDISGNTEDKRPNSPISTHNDEEKQMITRPVLSLKCLHEDIDEEIPPSKSDGASFPTGFININEVPELSIKNLDNNESQLPNPEPITPKASTVICIPVHLKTVQPVIPARSNFKGAHNFIVKVDCSALPKKSESPAYSESRNKLYVCKDNPFKILVSAENVPSGSFLRVHAVFSRLEYSTYAPLRCPTHAQQDYIRGHPAYEHFVQCVSDAAIYEKNTKTGRLSVSVPYEKPQDGETCTTYLLKLTCFSSCSGGINRRPFTLVFTLEKDNIPLGRQVMEAKVCACPVRDFKTDNEKEEKKKFKHDDLEENSQFHIDTEKSEHDEETPKLVDINGCHEPSQSSSSNGAKYSIMVKDRELFEFLKHMKVLYETGVHKISSDT